MKIRSIRVLGLLLFLSPLALAQPVTGPVVRFDTVVGNIDVELFPDRAPKTVANFLRYVQRGDYDNTIFHRSVRNFIIQGGGYKWQNGQATVIPEDAPVENEYRISNTRGTIAMAKLDGDPNSATSQWFFNTANNGEALNGQNGGFTVFGRVASQASLSVMARIASLPIDPSNETPLLAPGALTDDTVVLVRSIRLIPFVSANGVITAGDFGGSSSAAPGSFIEIYGTNLSPETRTWSGADFVNGKAPTSLGEVTVSINDKPAYVYFVSEKQVNVQVPEGVTAGETVDVVVTSKGQASAAGRLPIKALAGGLFAKASFKVDGRQYVVATRSDGSYVSNGRIPDLPASPAVPGETIVLYGTGFGPVGSAPVAGQIVRGPTDITAPLRINIGDTEARVDYKGLVPDLVGLYQFNVVVPPGAQTGDLPVTVTLGTETLGQVLYLPVQQR